MRDRSRFLKSGAFAVIIALLVLSVAQVGPTQAGAPAQATSAATQSAGGTGGTGGNPSVGTGMVLFGPCPPAGMSATEEPSSGNAPGAAGAAVATQQSPSGPRAYVGVQVRPVDDCGGEIVQVVPDSPASQAGLAVGDIIVAVDCVPLSIFGMAMSGSAGTMATMSADMAAGNATRTDCSAVMNGGGNATASAGGAAMGMTDTFASQCLSAMGMMSTSGSEATAEADESDEYTVVDLLVCIIQSHKPGDTVLLTVERGTQELNIRVTLGSTTGQAGTGGTGAGGAATQAAGGTGGTSGGTGGTGGGATQAATSGAGGGGATAAPTTAATTAATAAATAAATP